MTGHPFMQLYVADYLADTRHLSTEQHGAYLLLLMTMWKAGGSLPAEPKKLARIAGVNTRRWHLIWSDIEDLFIIDGDTLTQKRLEQEYQKAVSKSEKRIAAGARGGRAKALKNNKQGLANASVLPKHLLQTSESKKEKDGLKTVSRSQVSPDDPVLNRPDDPLAEYSDGEIAMLTVTFDLLDIESELTDLVDWAYRKGISKPNERKKAIYAALQKKQLSLDAGRELANGGISAPPVSREAIEALNRRRVRA
ncbi:MAG: DUF1376 domain-containing protein [Hyphomicrobiales bacterium]|nr:DUF1376 domain-containing protein [Hyphomicrobiales bacterium]